MESREKARLFGLRNGVLVGAEISQVFGAIKDNPVPIELIPEPPKPRDPPVPKEKPPNWTPYMFERLREVAARAKNFELRADEFEAELLRRNLLEAGFAQMVVVIESIIRRSRLSPREKAGAKRNLERLNGIFDSVAGAQSGAGSVESATKNGNGSRSDDDDN